MANVSVYKKLLKQTPPRERVITQGQRGITPGKSVLATSRTGIPPGQAKKEPVFSILPELNPIPLSKPIPTPNSSFPMQPSNPIAPTTPTPTPAPTGQETQPQTLDEQLKTQPGQFDGTQFGKGGFLPNKQPFIISYGGIPVGEISDNNPYAGYLKMDLMDAMKATDVITNPIASKYGFNEGWQQLMTPEERQQVIWAKEIMHNHPQNYQYQPTQQPTQPGGKNVMDTYGTQAKQPPAV